MIDTSFYRSKLLIYIKVVLFFITFLISSNSFADITTTTTRTLIIKNEVDGAVPGTPFKYSIECRNHAGGRDIKYRMNFKDENGIANSVAGYSSGAPGSKITEFYLSANTSQEVTLYGDDTIDPNGAHGKKYVICAIKQFTPLPANMGFVTSTNTDVGQMPVLSNGSTEGLATVRLNRVKTVSQNGISDLDATTTLVFKNKNTSVAPTTNTLKAEVLLPNGDPNSLGPINAEVICLQSGSPRWFRKTISSAQGEVIIPTPTYGPAASNKRVRCIIVPRAEGEQRKFFRFSRNDDGDIRSDGVIRALDAAAVDGKKLTVSFDHSPDELSTIDVRKVIPTGDGGNADGEGSKGPFDVKVLCNGVEGRKTFEFEMGGVTDPSDESQDLAFQYKKGRMACAIRETLTANQKGFFVQKAGDTLGSDNGVMRATAATDLKDEFFTMTNTYYPDGVVSMEVKKLTPTGVGTDDSQKGPFDIVVGCVGTNGRKRFDLSLDGDETATIQYPKRAGGAQTGFRCAVREVLTADQRKFFKTEYGNDQGIRPKARVLYHNATLDAEGKVVTVTNTYHPDGVVSMDIEKLTPNGGKGPFDIKVRCIGSAGLHEYEFEMDGDDKLTFQYPKRPSGQRTGFRCAALETLTSDQHGFFKVKRTNDQDINNNRAFLFHGDSRGIDATDKTLTVTNIYYPDGVDEMTVRKVLPNGDKGKGPFNVSVRCLGSDGRDDYTFSLDGSEDQTFQYKKGEKVQCIAYEKLEQEQIQFFRQMKGDTQGVISDARILGNANLSPDGEKFVITNNYVKTGLSDTDTDGDGISDDLEIKLGLDPNNPDSDGNGVPDTVVPNGAGLLQHRDTDGDGISDSRERLLGLNPNNPDSDGDGTPDGEEHPSWVTPIELLVEIDSDGDGLSDRVERSLGLNPNNSDTDGNGTPDGEEDMDGDGLSNIDEITLYQTNPANRDTDGNGVDDGEQLGRNLPNGVVSIPALNPLTLLLLALSLLGFGLRRAKVK